MFAPILVAPEIGARVDSHAAKRKRQSRGIPDSRAPYLSCEGWDFRTGKVDSGPVTSSGPELTLFSAPASITDKYGQLYRIESLTREAALSQAEVLSSLHSLIPGIEPLEHGEFLSDGTVQRPYPHKLTLSLVVRAKNGAATIGFLTAYLRSATDEHPIDSVYIHRFAIALELQRRRLGTEVLRAVVARIFSTMPWLQNISVQTNQFDYNIGVVRFYESNGFRKMMTVVYPTKIDWVFVLRRSSQTITATPYQLLVKNPRLIGDDGYARRVFLATTNRRKRDELSELFQCYNVIVDYTEPPTILTEPQIDTGGPELETELIRHPLRQVARFLETRDVLPFVVEDTMIFIDFFNRNESRPMELPGYDTKRWWQQLGAEGVLALMADTKQRGAHFVSQIGAYLGAGTSAIPSFFRGPKCNWRWAIPCDDSRMTSPEARVRGSELSSKRSPHAQCGTLGPSVRPL